MHSTIHESSEDKDQTRICERKHGGWDRRDTEAQYAFRGIPSPRKKSPCFALGSRQQPTGEAFSKESYIPSSS